VATPRGVELDEPGLTALEHELVKVVGRQLNRARREGDGGNTREHRKDLHHDVAGGFFFYLFFLFIFSVKKKMFKNVGAQLNNLACQSADKLYKFELKKKKRGGPRAGMPARITSLWRPAVLFLSILP
jgi:hypothetical protein